MTFDTRYTWEKLVLELKLLRVDDFGALVPLCLGIHTLLWPKDGAESGFRQAQFLGFELLKACENLGESDRWETLRAFVFEDKGYQLTGSRLGDVREKDVLMKTVLDERCGHPLPVVFLLLHLSHFLDLPMSLVQARHHFLLKWVRAGGKTVYLDLYNEARPLTDQELISVLNRSSSSLETSTAKQLIVQYLELLMHVFDRAQALSQLHMIYNVLLSMDDSNTAILGQRALLRQKLGFTREALCDLKRYFSFVEQSHAPSELQQAWMELEAAPQPPTRGATDVLH